MVSKKLKKQLILGKIGEVKFVNIKLYWPEDKNFDKNNIPWRYNPEISGAGLFYDLASHQLDYLDYIFGPIKEAQGSFTNQAKLYPAEDIVSASFQFESNIIGTGLWCFTVNEVDKLDQTEIVGTKGKITFSFFDQTPIEIISEGQKELINPNWAKHVQEPLIKTVVDDLLEKGKSVSTGESGARTNWVMDKILNRIIKIIYSILMLFIGHCNNFIISRYLFIYNRRRTNENCYLWDLPVSHYQY